jgi:hypothetical protein
MATVALSMLPLASADSWPATLIWRVLAAKLLLLAALPLALPLPFAQQLILQAACLAPILWGCLRDCAPITAAGQGKAVASTFTRVVQVRDVMPALSATPQGSKGRQQQTWVVLQAINEGSRQVLAPFKLYTEPPSPARACRQVLAHAHIMLCIVLPSMGLYLWEARLRNQFQAAKRRRRIAGLVLGLPEATVMSTLVISLFALVVWEAVQYV